MFKKRLTLLLLLPLALAGCGPFWVDPYITVRDSPLNWIEIHYYNLNQKPLRRVWVRVEGTGLVEVRKGTSDLVSNDFAKKYRSETWGDIRTSRVHVDTEHIRNIYQNLVNYGVLDREKFGRASKKKGFRRFIAVKANINSITYSEQQNIFETDPDLAEQLLDVVREFENPGR